MIKRLKTALLIAGVALCPSLAQAQADVHFSQFYETSILRNPSLTGIFSNDYKVGAYYRNQWSSISNPFVTTSAYGEVRMPIGHFSNDYLSIGLLGYSDKAGSLNQTITSVYPAINFSKSLNQEKNRYLSVGFTAGYTQYGFDKSNATFNNQFVGGIYNANNPTYENLSNTKMSMWDLGAGINYNTSSGPTNDVTYILGISGYHLTQPQFSYDKIPGVTQNMRWNVNGAVGFSAMENLSVQLHTNLAIQGTYMESVTGGLVTLSEKGGGPKPAYSITAGIFYRLQDAFIPVVKLKYKNTAVSMSYDVNTSTLQQASKLRGGYEIAFSITGDFNSKSGAVKKTVCPKF